MTYRFGGWGVLNYNHNEPMLSLARASGSCKAGSSGLRVLNVWCVKGVELRGLKASRS